MYDEEDSDIFTDQDKIIESLRKELATQKEQSGDSKALRAQLASLQAENELLQTETKALQGVQNEVKTLQAKLVATRAQSESAVAAAKASVTSKGSTNSSASSSQGGRIDEARAWKMKEDLYTDLTGLMIHSVKRVDGEEVFDCIQTGRNGSMFYKFRMYYIC